jgi:hypothetical protein
MKRALAAVVVLFSIAAFAAPAQAARTVYRGQWQCDDRGTVTGLGGIELQLWRRGETWLPVEWTGGIADRGHTNEDGTFALTSGEGEDTHFVRMALRDAAGVRLKDFWGINDWSIDSVGLRNNVAEHNMGGLLLSTPGQSHKCAIWSGLHRAHANFRTVTGTNPPSGGLLVQADAVTAGVPFTPHTEIWWPGGFPTGYSGGGDDSITRHEFGHVIRHGLDGDLGHFLGDVVTHNYLQNHETCNKTNRGFAFNEGWAEYWANDYAPAPSCDGRAADDYEVEGNVAAALAGIERDCYGGNRASMVAVLRAHPGVIHSFQDFQARVVCPVTAVAVPATLAPPRPVMITSAQAAAIAREQVGAASRIIRNLQVDLRSARRAAATLPRCVRRPCLAALEEAMSPAAIQAEIQLAKIVRNSVDDVDTAAEQDARKKLTLAQLISRLKAKEKANRTKAAKVSANGIRKALKAAKPVFGRDKSRATRRLRSLLNKRMAAFKRAAKRSSAPAGVVLDQAIVDRLRRVSTRTFPDPQPTPTPTPTPSPTPTPTPTPTATPDPRGDSTLTIDVCPGQVVSGKPIDVEGTLTPANPGTEVTVTFTKPPLAPVVRQTKTDAGGKWTSSHTPGPNDVGEWSVKATWPGDADDKPSESAVCTVNYVN